MLFITEELCKPYFPLLLLHSLSDSLLKPDCQGQIFSSIHRPLSHSSSIHMAGTELGTCMHDTVVVPALMELTLLFFGSHTQPLRFPPSSFSSCLEFILIWSFVWVRRFWGFIFVSITFSFLKESFLAGSVGQAHFGASLVAQLVKNLPAMRETWVWSLGWEDPLEKRKATHSSILAWRIPWTIVHGVAKSQTWLSDFHFLSLVCVWKVCYIIPKKSPFSSCTIQGWLSCILSGCLFLLLLLGFWVLFVRGRSLLCYMHYKSFSKKPFICGKLLHWCWNEVNHWGS